MRGLEHEFFVHGMDIHVMENGVTRLFVVNHAYSGDVVELFDHVIGSTILQWKETVRDPLFKSLNGLASLGPRAFYVTNDFDSDHARDPWKRGMDLVMPSNQSSVVHWNGEGRRVASGFAFANGIVVSNDGTRVVVAEMVGQRLSVLERDNVTNDLTLAKRLDTHMSIDNMSKDVQGNIYVTAQPSLYKVLLFQLGYSKSVPSILLQLKKDYSLSEFYRDDGDMTSVSTHAVVDHQRRLFVVGSFYDTCVALCSM
jgi:arylesterase/paraoxonase